MIGKRFDGLLRMVIVEITTEFRLTGIVRVRVFAIFGRCVIARALKTIIDKK